MRKVLIVVFFALLKVASAQPENPNNPACSSPNPPWWCDEQPVPIDDYLWVLFLVGVLVIVKTLRAEGSIHKRT